MSQFFQRVLNYVGNEIIVKGLANSRTFQRFAVRTDNAYKEYAKQGTEKLNSTLDEFATRAASTSTTSGGGSGGSMKKGPPQPPLTGFPGFISSFFKEIRKDIVGGK